MDSALTSKRSYSHAVCRSSELLSCAKTAVKIAQSRWQQNKSTTNGTRLPNDSSNSDWIGNLNPSDLELYNHNKQHQHSPLNAALEDGLEILEVMESELQRLNELVRRRGHSNDPTQEISASVAAIEKDVVELTSIVQTMVTRGSVGRQQNQQRQKHIKVIQEWFQTMIQHYAAQLKDILSVRATVLAEQARRRGMFQPNSNTTTNTSAMNNNRSGYSSHIDPNSSVTNEAQNALFAPLPHRSNPQSMYSSYPPQSKLNNGATSQKLSNGYGSGGGSSTANAGAGGYGGNYYSTNHHPHDNGVGSDATTVSSETGMRRRKQPYSTSIPGGGVTTNNHGSDGDRSQQQLSVLEQPQHNRQTAARLKEARQAEQSLAALGTIFGKMSTLIVQQSETLSKIEDDVEAAHVDVDAGHNEITTLYSIKKGNRMLIIKVYSLLIFLIVFMRFYVKK